MVGRLIIEDHETSFVCVVPESVKQLAFHPLRSNGGWREDQKKPVTPRQRLPDLVVPLLGSNDIPPAVPVRNTMGFEDVSNPRRELMIY